MKSLPAFKRALLDALMADASVAALVGKRVYDVPPRDNRGLPADIGAGAPYIYLGPVGAARDAACDPLWRVTARLYAVSFAAHREEAWAIAGASVAALDMASIAFAGGMHTPELWITQAGDVVDPVSPALVFVDVTTSLHDQ